MRRKTFQYQASWDPRKCTERLSEYAVLTSQALLRMAENNGWHLAPARPNGPCGAGWGLSCLDSKESCVSTIVPQSRPHRRTNILQDRGLELSHANSLHFLFQPKGDAHSRRAVWQKGLLASLLGSGKMVDGEHSTLYNSAPWSCAMP